MRFISRYWYVAFLAIAIILCVPVAVVRATTPNQLEKEASGVSAAALTRLKRLASSRNAEAECYLGLLYDTGQGVPQNYAKAAKWWRRAALQGNRAAEDYLGDLYDTGQGVPQDYAKALKWYRQAALQGNAPAECNIGYLYAAGQGVPQNYAIAARWYRKAALQGNRAAECNLGSLYHNSQGVPQDYAKALKWYRQAALQGYASAEYNIGHLYANSQGVPQDYAKALKWYRQAALQGYASAEYNIGYLYAKGHGVPQDYTKAAAWSRKAATQGYARAECSLGYLYAAGQGVPQDYAKALKWLILAKANAKVDTTTKKASAHLISIIERHVSAAAKAATIPAGDGVVKGSAFIVWNDGSSHSLRGLQVMIASLRVPVSDVAKNLVAVMKGRIGSDKEQLENDENVEKGRRAIPSVDKTWKKEIYYDKIHIADDEARLTIAKNMLTSTKTQNTFTALCEMLVAKAWPQRWLNVITSATCDINGRFAMNVPPGHYYVFAKFPRGLKYFPDIWCIPITVQAGQTVRINLTKDNILSAPQ